MKLLHSICQLIWKTQYWPQDWERSVFISIPKKGNAKECSSYHTIALISHTSKLMLKILQARLQQYVNQEFPDVQAGFRKGRGTRDQIANICHIIGKAREFQKNIYLCFIAEKAMAPHSSTFAWKIPWTEEPNRLESTGSLRVRHDWATSLSLFSLMHWRRKWQPTLVFLPGEYNGQRSLVGYSPWARKELDTTELLHFLSFLFLSFLCLF